MITYYLGFILFISFYNHLSANNISVTYNSGDKFLDMILAGKEALANRHQIMIRTTILLPKPKQINSVEFSLIVINLLDNAIEEIKRSDIVEGFRVIELLIRQHEQFYVICVENMSDIENRTPGQIKDLLIQPGLGLKIIKEIVDKNHGILEIHHQNFQFSVNIKLPIEKHDREEE